MIVRTEKNKNFTMIDNGIISNPNLSAKAKGIMIYVLSRPDEWQFYEEEIVRHFKDGKDSIKVGLKELEGNGYLVKTRERDKGRIIWSYTFYEDNTIHGNSMHGNSMHDNSMHDNSMHGKSATNNTNINKTDASKTDPNLTETDTSALRAPVERLIDSTFRACYYHAFGKEFKNDDGTDYISGIEEFYTAMQDMKHLREDEWFDPENKEALTDIFDWFFLKKTPEKPYLPVLTGWLYYTCDYNHDAFIEWRARKQKKVHKEKKVILKGQEHKTDIYNITDPEELPFI